MITISVRPAQEGAALVTVGSFTDEDGATVTPTTFAWTLSTKQGTIINSRNAVSVTPAATIKVLLTGDDLKIGTYGTERVFTVDATYNSTLGSGIPLRAQASFSIEKFVIDNES